MDEMILIRFGEMTLKKDNYRFFLDKVKENIRFKCRKFPLIRHESTKYRYYLYLNNQDPNEVIKILDTIPGLYSYSICKKVPASIEEIAKEAVILLQQDAPNRPFTCKVETHRGDKSFPLTSLEISQQVAKLVLPHIPHIKVDVHQPEMVLNIDLRKEGTYIYTKTHSGLGGYPSGVAGGGLLLMSGGIDSPVAGFLTMNKGVNLEAIHFASPPHTSDQALQKVYDLTRTIAIYHHKEQINLHTVAFTAIQNRIHERANPIYTVTLMRRAMMIIASRIAIKRNLDCLITGESIGQVASQTLENIRVVNDVTNFPIIRPLITMDKEEIISFAKKIKTFDISILPFEDCCTVFVPPHPVIKPKLDLVLLEQAKCEWDTLIEEAVAGVKETCISHDTPTQVLQEDWITF